MRSGNPNWSFHWTLISTAIAALLGGCVIDQSLQQDGGLDVPPDVDGGVGGAGGFGGSGGAAGSGGAGGGSLLACPALRSPGCEARDDCQWTGLRCVELAPPCGANETDEVCAAAECFWWDAGCHESGDPRRCDQPEPASCEAAGCEWDEVRGCLAEGAGPARCEDRGAAACALDRRCVLREVEICGADGAPEEAGFRAPDPDPGCRVERSCLPAPDPCGDLDADGCLARVDCRWQEDASGEAADRDCYCAGDACEACAAPQAPWGCLPASQAPRDACEGLGIEACDAAAQCASRWVNPCDRAGGAGPDPSGYGRADPGSCDFLQCGRALTLCPSLDAVECDAVAGCTGLWDEQGAFLGCWTEGDCEALPPDRCDAHPACERAGDTCLGR